MSRRHGIRNCHYRSDESVVRARMLLPNRDHPVTDTMNTSRESAPFPDSTTLAPELVFGDYWSPEAVSEMIRSKCAHGETPAFLYVGKTEAALLREHLAEVFGTDAVSTLRDTYYMGLEVVEIECESFLFAGGRKAVRTLQDPLARRPSGRDRVAETLRQFRI